MFYSRAVQGRSACQLTVVLTKWRPCEAFRADHIQQEENLNWRLN